jgi:thiosulfate/3-mercaptopyruvate sulfurtransferase
MGGTRQGERTFSGGSAYFLARMGGDMRTRRRSGVLLAVSAAVVLVTACATTGPRPAAEAPTAIDPLVTTEWLSRHLAEEDLVVLDCTVHVAMSSDGGVRVESGRVGYERGHIAGAGFADLTGDLAEVALGQAAHFKFALPAPERFAAAMGALGVGDGSRVVLYSATRPDWAARVWWMLRWIGFDRVALLDGGLQAWTAEGRPLSTEAFARPAARLTVSLRPEVIADRDEVRAALGKGSVSIIDAMPEASFQGKFSLYARPGHIPGAANIPSSTLVDESGRFLAREALATLHGDVRPGRVITYCGGGIAASSNAFVMTRLGFDDVAVYIGSLDEWAADPANPMETGTP